MEYSFEQLSPEISVCVSPHHRFGTDAFLLADFAQVKKKDLVCDLGTGCGIIPLIITRGHKEVKIHAVDIQEEAIDQLNMAITKCNLTNIYPHCCDLKSLNDELCMEKFSLVTCNPPYKANNAGIESLDDAHKIARHEILCNINDVCRAGNRLLKFGGRLCLCNRPERLADVIKAMQSNNIEPKRIRFVSKTPQDSPWLFLIEGKKGSKPFMQIMPQLYIKGETGYSKELLRIYGDFSE